MIHVGSTECAPAAVDIFSAPCKETDISRRNKVDFYPVADLKYLEPSDFVKAAFEDDHWDLNIHSLGVKLKVVKQDGANFTKTDEVTLVNFLLHSLFRHSDIAKRIYAMHAKTSQLMDDRNCKVQTHMQSCSKL